MSQQIPDLNALTPDTRQFLEPILSDLAQIHNLTDHMSEKDAVESLLNLLQAGFIKLGYAEDADGMHFSIVLPDDLEVVAVH